MAQTGYTPILIYSSSTAAAAPAAGSLTNSTLGSELAINITDGKLFYKDNANAIQVIGWKVVPATAGGTGQTSYAVGDILYADTTTSLAKLADVATGNALISGGVGVAPSWGKIGLTTHVSGTLPVANGGTGTATVFTAGSVVFAGASGVYSQNNTRLFWDNSNNRLGIGTGAPSQPLDVRYAGSGSGPAIRFGSATYGMGQLEENSSINAVVFKNVYSTSGLFVWMADTAERGRFDASGNLKIENGNLIVGTSGKGIDFSATPGTGTSELLADYEEGTWTPTATGGLTVNSAAYTKVGRQVTITADVTAVSTTSGDISGLPFTNGARNGSGVVGYQTETATVTWGLIIDASSTNMSFRLGATQQQLSTGKRAYFSAVYFV